MVIGQNIGRETESAEPSGQPIKTLRSVGSKHSSHSRHFSVHSLQLRQASQPLVSSEVAHVLGVHLPGNNQHDDILGIDPQVTAEPLHPIRSCRRTEQDFRHLSPRHAEGGSDHPQVSRIEKKRQRIGEFSPTRFPIFSAFLWENFDPNHVRSS